MEVRHTKNIVIAVLVLVVVLIGGYALYVQQTATPEPSPVAPTPVAEPAPEVRSSTIGTSVEGRTIDAYQLGSGETHLLFVGGMHGGYEWNSTLLAYEMLDYLEEDLSRVPEDVTVHIIPNLNPDGMALAVDQEGRFTAADVTDPTTRVAAGRFNANQVDLNRNFDCKWAPESSWRGETVSAGTEPFSEPEAAALRDYVQATNPEAVVFWHSQANNVYASECEAGVLPETLTLMSTYAQAADYGEVPVFDAYPITGDAEGWLASIGIPAVTVELETANSIEWPRNLAGTMATLELYSVTE